MAADRRMTMGEMAITSFTGPLVAVIVPACTEGWPIWQQVVLMVAIVIAVVGGHHMLMTHPADTDTTPSAPTREDRFGRTGTDLSHWPPPAAARANCRPAEGRGFWTCPDRGPSRR